MSDREDILELLARYVRATDSRDGAGLGALFTADSVTQMYVNHNGTWEEQGQPLHGPDGVRWAVDELMSVHPDGGWSHHMTADHLVEIDGDTAHLSAQFVAFRVRAGEPPAAVETGYYDADLVRAGGRWRFHRHRVVGDAPFRLRQEF